MRVLLIEDDQSVADFIVKGLREAGYEVEHVADGKEGLFAADSDVYDVLILDRMLPRVDGLSIAEAICSQQEPMLKELDGHPGHMIACHLRS